MGIICPPPPLVSLGLTLHCTGTSQMVPYEKVCNVKIARLYIRFGYVSARPAFKRSKVDSLTMEIIKSADDTAMDALTMADSTKSYNFTDCKSE